MDDSICPFCGHDEQIVIEDELLKYVMCIACKACGPCADNLEDAHLNWMVRADYEDSEAVIGKRRNSPI